jgi:hypothetical protein
MTSTLSVYTTMAASGMQYVTQPSQTGVPGPPLLPMISWLMNGRPPARGSVPLITPKPVLHAPPPSASPAPRPSWANAAWTGLMTRSSTLVVASEADAGKPGLPTTQPSRSKTVIRRNVPALRGRSSGSALSTPMTAPLVDDASDRLNPAGTQSGLSRRSTVIRPAPGSMSTTTRTGMPSSMPGSGSCELSATSRPAGSRPMAAAASRSE